LKYVNIDVASYFAPSSKVKVDTLCLNFDPEAQSYSTANEAVHGKATAISASSVSIFALAVAFVVAVLL
jgi:hypothetical protein